MANYTFNAVYTAIETAALTVASDAYCSTRYEPIPDSFPAVYVEEVSRVRTPSGITLNYTDDQNRVIHEVQVWSNLQNGARAQAYAMMEAITAAYNSLFFRLTMMSPMPTTDRSIYRLVARFTKQVTGGDTLPEGD